MHRDSELAAWIRLTHIPGLGGQGMRKLLSSFGLPTQIFATDLAALERHVGAPLAERILGHDVRREIDITLKWANQAGNSIVTLADADYPRQLLQIPDPPVLLYVRGSVELSSRDAIAIIGSRNATAQGIANAEAFAETLSAAGLSIISGLALGIDAAAHRGALRRNGSTLAVLGTGVDCVYPARNRDLFAAIAERGALISEFALGTPAIAGNFPRRNRVISGLARGVLVVEAAISSGSLITARLAGEQGREIFAIPGSIHSPLSKGCHDLIKQGAKLVESAQDVLDELRIAPALFSHSTGLPMSDEGEFGLLPHLGHDPCSVDLLCQRSGLTPEAVSAMLLTLELEGKVASLPGGRYQRVN